MAQNTHNTIMDYLCDGDSLESGNKRVVIGMGFARTAITCFLWEMIHVANSYGSSW